MARNKTASSYTITGQNPYPWIRWWYNLAAPKGPAYTEEITLAEREFLRKGKLISIALLFELLQLLLEIQPATQSGNGAFIATSVVFISIAVLLVAVALNRIGKQFFASILTIADMEIGIVLTIIIPLGYHQNAMQLLPSIFLFIQPLMVSVLLFAPRGILVTGTINIILTVLILITTPMTTDLEAFMNSSQGSTIYAIALTDLFICAFISFVMISSLQENLVRADKAEEISKLQQTMAKQVQQELQTKRQLEGGIQEIITQLTRFSNGDQQARIQLEQGHVLWSIAGNINNMIGRFVRLREQEQPMEQTFTALQAHINAVRMAKIRGTQLQLPRTMTDVDTLAEELLSYYHFIASQQPQNNNRS
jgi:hypothetical protein